MDLSQISFCPHRASINSTWSAVQVTEHAKPLTVNRDPQYTKHTAPVTFTGTAKDLELLEACNENSGMHIYMSTLKWDIQLTYHAMLTMSTYDRGFN